MNCRNLCTTAEIWKPLFLFPLTPKDLRWEQKELVFHGVLPPFFSVPIHVIDCRSSLPMSRQKGSPQLSRCSYMRSRKHLIVFCTRHSFLYKFCAACNGACSFFFDSCYSKESRPNYTNRDQTYFQLFRQNYGSHLQNFTIIYQRQPTCSSNFFGT